MKRRYVVTVLLVALFLITLDQGSKLWIASTHPIPDFVHAEGETGTLHIHPYLNDEMTEALSPMAERLGMDVRWLLLGEVVGITLGLALIFLVMVDIPRYFLWDVPRPPKGRFRRAADVCGPALYIALLVCGAWMDELLWGGSLDWIAVIRRAEHADVLPGHNHGGFVYQCRTWDIKDLYVILALCMMFVYGICMVITLLRQPKEVRAGYDEKGKHPIRNIRAMRADRRSRKETRS